LTRAAASRAAIAAAIQETSNDLGEVTPDAVVEAAKDEDSPLHAEFEWNDGAAAHQHRLAQARYLIREITYEVSPRSERVISEISYTHTPGRTGQGYITLGAAARNRETAQAVLQEEIGRCESSMNRARQVADVLGLRDDVDEALRGLTAIRRKAIAKGRRPAREMRQ